MKKKKNNRTQYSFREFTFKDEGHGILKPKNQKIIYKLINNFFDESLLEHISHNKIYGKAFHLVLKKRNMKFIKKYHAFLGRLFRWL